MSVLTVEANTEKTLVLPEATDMTVELGDNARLNLINLNTEQSKIVINQASHSRFHYFTACVGQDMVNDLQVNLNARGAECDLFGLSVLAEKQRADFVANITHHVGQTRSREFYRSIVNDNAINAFAGKITMVKDAQKSATEQANHNLLLSKFAEAKTKPQLEIYADDVKASHGATVGQLDEDALFYLRSRGIDEKAAIQMLVMAFAEEVIEYCMDDEVKAKVKQLIMDCI